MISWQCRPWDNDDIKRVRVETRTNAISEATAGQTSRRETEVKPDYDRGGIAPSCGV